MADYEVSKIPNFVRLQGLSIAGVGLTLTVFDNDGTIHVKTTRALTATEETNMKNTLNTWGLKVIWKDGAIQP